MYPNEQGVQKPGQRLRLFGLLCLLLILCSTQIASARTVVKDRPLQEVTTKKHHVYIAYPHSNTLYSNIVKKLSETLRKNHSDITVVKLTPQAKININKPKTDIIIAIGRLARQSLSEKYTATKKLFISSAPDTISASEQSNATLYMTQSYCQQVKFIRLLNQRWKTISIISSTKKTINRLALQQCARKFGFELYIANTDNEPNQTNAIKQALQHSEVLLALPDSSIYNSRTVKNILLTSYRYRRPVIAFSKNFVNAGALASIHSNTDQIAHSASLLIEQYFDTKKLQPVNHPSGFDISINKQVFRALDLAVPDTEAIKDSLSKSTNNSAEKAQ